jgi:MFS family permease
MASIKNAPFPKNEIRKVFGHEERDCIEPKTPSKITFKKILKIENIPYMLALYFMVFLGFSIFYTAFPVHAVKTLHWSITSMGIFFTVLGTLMIIVQGPLLSRLSKLYSDSTLVLWGSVILGTNFVLMSFSDTVMSFVAAVFFALGNGIMWPSVLSLLSRIAGKKYQGSVQGFASAMTSFAGIIGLTLGGILYVWLNSVTFIICAVIIYLTFILSLRLTKFEKKCLSKEDFEKQMSGEPQPVNT